MDSKAVTAVRNPCHHMQIVAAAAVRKNRLLSKEAIEPGVLRYDRFDGPAEAADLPNHVQQPGKVLEFVFDEGSVVNDYELADLRRDGVSGACRCEYRLVMTGAEPRNGAEDPLCRQRFVRVDIEGDRLHAREHITQESRDDDMVSDAAENPDPDGSTPWFDPGVGPPQSTGDKAARDRGQSVSDKR
jgi:hypothetical protein